jgi:hypothetical protein
MPPTHMELLKAAKDHDAKQTNVRVKINKAIIEAGAVEAAPLPPLTAVIPVDENDDPFNGNQNNRRVAERMIHGAMHRENQKTAVVDLVDPLTHTQRTLADIQKSKRVDPDPLVERDVEIPASLTLPPTPGSPAARKAALGKTDVTNESAALNESKPFSDVNPAGVVAAGTAPQGAAPAEPPTWKPNA